MSQYHLTSLNNVLSSTHSPADILQYLYPDTESVSIVFRLTLRLDFEGSKAAVFISLCNIFVKSLTLVSSLLARDFLRPSFVRQISFNKFLRLHYHIYEFFSKLQFLALNIHSLLIQTRPPLKRVFFWDFFFW